MSNSISKLILQMDIPETFAHLARGRLFYGIFVGGPISKNPTKNARIGYFLKLKFDTSILIKCDKVNQILPMDTLEPCA